MLGSPRAASFAVIAALLLSCGEKFSGVDPGATGGGAGTSSAGSDATASGSDAGGAVGSGGKSVGGRAGSSATGGGKGGMPAQGGSNSGAGGVVAVAGGGHGGALGGSGGALGGSGGVLGGSGGSGGVVVVGPPPVPVDGLELWFRADEGVTQNAGVVSTWKDLSGKHCDALQTVLNVRPKLVADALAGKPALVFDGTDDFLKLPTLDIDFTSGLSVFVVAQQPSVSTCEGYFEASNGSEIDDIHFGFWQGSLLFEVDDNWINDTNYPALLNAPQVAVVIQDAQAFAHVRSNSNDVGSGSVNLAPQLARAQAFLGKSLYGDCTTFEGAMGEVLVYSRPVSDEELLQIEGYLQDKWACCGQ
ncbi:MAG TPA: hypothetical protein VNG33_19560 [Polyangiaceae bacterium]|nr:hypothetical protein [Polyangiaceae bacterium]